jgi:predicted dehydrogenase
MSSTTNSGPSRRDALVLAGGVALGTAAIGPYLHAAGSDTVQVALVGCGGRGTGAAENALHTVKQGPIKVVAMADVFEDRLNSSLRALERDDNLKKQLEVKDSKFIGFDAYQKAMDALKPGDVVILTTPPAFRWLHFKYAISKGLNVFMEKPTTVDGPSTRKMLELAEEATKKNLKVGVGLMCRHCPARGELAKRIKNGEMGDLVLLRAYRLKGPEATSRSKMMPKGENELAFQIRRFHSFLWASGGCYSDFLIHNIDECCWMKDAWPVKAQANGGRMYRIDPADGKEFIDQNFDSYSVEYTFADGSKLQLEGRIMPDCHQEFASYAHGTKGSAVISSNSHWPSHCRIYKGQNFVKDDIVWQCGPERAEDNPYQVEWDKFIAAIRTDKPHNEAVRGAQASLVTSMGRMAAHTGQVITYEQILKDGPEMAPGLDKLSFNGEAPVKADANGRYPVPQPGIKKDREY